MTIIRTPSNTPQPSADKGYNHSVTIEKLLHSNPKLWRGCDMAGQGFRGQSTGFPQLDDILPSRGWPQSGLIEVITPCWGIGELQLLIPLMRSVVEQGKWVLWITPPHMPYAPALVQVGVNTDQMLVVKRDTSCKDALWSMEKALQTSNFGLVLTWQNWLPGKVLRRLQLAAENGNTLGVFFKQHDSKYSPSQIRLKIKDSLVRSNNKEASDFSETEITVINARGNFRPLTTRVNLYQPS